MKRMVSMIMTWLMVQAGYSQCLEIHQIDVGHGDATVLVERNVAELRNRIGLSDPTLVYDSCDILKIAIEKGLSLQQTVNRAILIDAGVKGVMVDNYLKSIGVTKINIALVSHYHDDHYKGFIDLTTSFDTLVDRGIRNEPSRIRAGKKTDYGRFRAQTVLPKTTLSLTAPINIPLTIAGATLRCVVVNDSVYATPKTEFPAGDSENNYSMGWLLDYGPFSYLTSGDLGGYSNGTYVDGETRLVEGIFAMRAGQGSGCHVCALKINHHGSEMSSNEYFLNNINPTMCVISCGKSQHHLPRSMMIDRIKESRIATNFYLTGLDAGVQGLDSIGYPGKGVIGGDVVLIVDDAKISSGVSSYKVYHHSTRGVQDRCRMPNGAAIVGKICTH